MEEEKRKKKNKKRKNKNITPTEEIQVSNNKNNSEAASSEQDTRALEKKNDNAEDLTEKASDGKNAIEGRYFDTLLQEKLAQYAGILAGKDDEIIGLKHENQTLLQKQASKDDEIIRLKHEIQTLLQKEAGKDDEIIRLKHANQTVLQKENCKEEDIKRLNAEKNFFLQKEVSTDNEMRNLSCENFGLKKEVGQLRESLENLSQDYQQLSTKFVAVQTGFQKLEMEARVRSRVEQDISVATKGVSKRWFVWGSSKDPVAEAVVIAEESCMQKEAAAAVVEKLVCENAELMEKINQLHATIDQLNQKCYNVRESRPHANTEENATTPLLLEFEEKGDNAKLMNSVAERNDPSISITSLDAIDADQPAIVSINNGTTSGGTETDQPAIVSINNYDSSCIESEIEVSTRCEDREDIVTITDVENIISVPESVAVIGEAEEIASEAVRISAETTIRNGEIVPFSDAPLMGAPLRLISFFKNYVSGADLVKPKNSVSSKAIS